MRKHIFYNTVNFQPVTFRILFFRGIQTLQMRLSRKAWFWWTQLLSLRPFCRAADEFVSKLSSSWNITYHLKARRALSLFRDVLLRTRRALSLYKVYGCSALLVCNGSLLNIVEALLVLNRRCTRVIMITYPCELTSLCFARLITDTPGHGSGWAETPRTDRGGEGAPSETPTPASKRRSRWDETPAGQTPSSTPMLQSGITPVGSKAAGMATPTPSGEKKTKITCPSHYRSHSKLTVIYKAWYCEG